MKFATLGKRSLVELYKPAQELDLYEFDSEEDPRSWLAVDAAHRILSNDELVAGYKITGWDNLGWN